MDKKFMLKLFFSFLFFSNLLQAEVIYLKPKAYLDVITGQMVSGKIIGIENGIIVSIGEKTFKRVIESDFYLLPGLIDCHTHLFFTQTLTDKNFEDALLREVKLSDDFRITRAKKFLKEYLSEGFTSVCDLGNSGQFLDVKLKEEVSSDPEFPSMYVSGPGLASDKGQFYPDTNENVVKHEYQIIDNKSDIDLILQIYLDKKIDILKIYMDNSPGRGGLDKVLVQKILKSSQIRNFKKITFHAIEGSSVKYLSTLPNVGVEHANYPVLFKSKNNYVTLTDLTKATLQEFNYYNKIYYSAQLMRAKSFFDNNVKLIFGPDFYFDRKDIHFKRAKYVKDSVRAWSEAQISTLAILQAMTINSARALKEDRNIGVIKVGSRANLIGVKENPLLEISTLEKVEFVMNKGKVILSRP